MASVAGMAPDWLARLESARALLQAHPEADINAQNNTGYTALSMAVSKGNVGPVRVLVDKLGHPSQLGTLGHECWEGLAGRG